MSPDEQESLYASVYRNTREDPMWLGYWINRFVESEHLSWGALSTQLGISPDKLVLLCLCRTPRPEHFQEDVLVVCERTGARVELVARMIRQEQAMMRWQKNEHSCEAGWMLAASDAVESSQSENDEEGSNGEERLS